MPILASSPRTLRRRRNRSSRCRLSAEDSSWKVSKAHRIWICGVSQIGFREKWKLSILLRMLKILLLLGQIHLRLFYQNDDVLKRLTFVRETDGEGSPYGVLTNEKTSMSLLLHPFFKITREWRKRKSVNLSVAFDFLGKILDNRIQRVNAPEILLGTREEASRVYIRTRLTEKISQILKKKKYLVTGYSRW